MSNFFMTEKHCKEIHEMNIKLSKIGAGISFYMHPTPSNQAEYDKLIELANESIKNQDRDLIDNYYGVDPVAIY